MLRSASFRSPRAALVLALLFGLACPLPAQETDASDFVRETPDAEGHETPVPALTLTIPEAQGAGHRSPYEGKLVALEGVVTAIEAGKGFYLQDPEGDGDPTTSDALFVFAEDLVPAAKSPEGEAAEQSETLRIRTIVVPEGSNPAAAARADAARPALPAIEVGDRVKVTGELLEIGEGEALTVTCLRASSFQAAEVTGEEPEDGAVGSLPEPVLLGRDGRPFPTEVLDDDGLARFEPTEDGLDFYEAVEGMRVEVRNARVVGPTNRHGDLTVVADRGLDATVATARGGLLRRDGDANPEALVLGGALTELPPLDVGAELEGSVVGVISYAYGSYRLEVTSPFPPVRPRPPLPMEATELRGGDQAFTVATFNALNVAASDPDAKLERLAEVVVTGLGSPDLLALQEVQDRDGREDSGVVEADSTFSRLAKAIVDAGGPVYAWRQLDPENNADGGAPGSNIRVGLMYRPERLDMVDSAAASPEEGGRAPRIVVEDGRPSLRPSPARLRHPSFDADEATGFGGTRKPLFVQARFRGEDLFLVVLHLISRRKDSPPMGAVQPQALHTEPRRLEQARQVRLVVDQILGADPDARVIVLGDVNDFPGRPVLRMLAGDRLENLVERIPETDRYTFNFRGNSQTLDHILVSRTLAAGAEVDIVHACADFAHVRAASDHDPVVARLRIGGEPKKSDAQP